MSIKDEIQAIFARDGWLVRSGGHHLPAQQAYADSVVDWLEGDSHPVALIEGETGTGKTLGYLFPILVHWARTGRKALISTFTVNLQNQLLDNDLGIVERYLNEQNLPLPRVIQRLGRQHFVDPERIDAVVSDSRNGSDPLIDKLADWGWQCVDQGRGLIEEWTREYGDLPDGITDEMICLNQFSSSGINPAYDFMARSTTESDILVTSHAMVMRDRLTKGQILGLNDESTVINMVFDEGDKLEEVAEMSCNRRIQFRLVSRELQDLKPYVKTSTAKKIRSLQSALDELEISLLSLSKRLGSDVIMIEEAVRNGPLKTLVDQLITLADGMVRSLDKYILMGSGRPHAENVLTTLNWIAQMAKESASPFQRSGFSFGLSPIQRIPSFVFHDAHPGIIYASLWNSANNRVMLTSATLGGRGDNSHKTSLFPEIASSLGIGPRKLGIQKQYAPDQFGDLDFVLSPASIPRPLRVDDETNLEFDSVWLEHAARMIDSAAQRGPTLVLTGSYREAQELGKRLTSQSLIDARGRRLSSLVSSLREGFPVLLSPRAWEGVSIRNEDGSQIIDQLVISRIPFLPPDPLGKKMLQNAHKLSGRLTPSASDRIFEHARRIRALRKLRQGFGRVIRHKDDVATIWIADPRFPRPGDTSVHKVMTRAISERFLGRYRGADVFGSRDGEPSPQSTLTADQKRFLLI